MSVRVAQRIGAITIVAASLVACGRSDDAGSSTGARTTEPSAGGSAATCDEASVANSIGNDVVDILELDCVDGWAAALYTDGAGLSRPVILRAEGQSWILQDWAAVCAGDPMVPGDIEVPESLRTYCPGG